MTDVSSTNVIGAMVLALSDGLLTATQSALPTNITAAGLTLIGHFPGISIQDLSIGLDLSHPGTVRLVDRMVADGLVRREKSGEDKRAVALFLCPKGKAQEALILSSRNQILKTALSGLSEAEIRTLAGLADKVLTSMNVREELALKICRLCDSENCDDCPIEAALIQQGFG